MLLLLSLLLVLFLLCWIFQKRFEQMLVPFVSALMLAIYPFALAQRLEAFVFFACGTAMLLLIWASVLCFRQKIKLASLPRLLCTPGFVCFALLIAFLYIGSVPRMVWWGDDIRYWALQPKSLYLSGGFLNGTMSLLPDFAAYMPGMPLFQWLGLAIFGEWHEGILFFMLWLFWLVLIMPFAERITWKKAYWSPLFMVFAIALPTILNSPSYSFLGVDTALGLCFGYILCQLWQLRAPQGDTAFHYTCLCLSLCVLVLLKQTGLLLFVLSISFLPFCLRSKAKPFALKPLLCTYLPPLLLVLSWFVFCRCNGLSGMHSSALSQHLNELLTGTWMPPAGYDQLLPSLWSALFSGRLSTPEHALMEIPSLYRMLFLCIAPLLLIPLFRQSKRDMKGLSLWACLVFLIELAGFYFSFATIFYTEVGEYVGEGLFLLPLMIERYFCPIAFGLAMLCLSLLLDSLKGISKQKNALLTAFALVALVLLPNWQSISYYCIPQNYGKQEQSYFAQSLAEQNFWTEELDSPQTAIVLYGIDELQTEPEKWQYALAPIKLVYERNQALTTDEFIALLRKQSITHVVFLDEANAIYNAALPLSPEEWFDTYVPYAVSWEDEQPILE